MNKLLFYSALFISAFLLGSCKDDDEGIFNNGPDFVDQVFDIGEDINSQSLIGKLLADDKEGDPLTFTIKTNDGNLFSLTSAGELTLAADQVLDFETKTSHQIVASVSDGTTEASATITINVLDVNETPVVENQSFEVSETVGEDVVLGTIVATDPEGDNLSYNISTNDNDFFEINAAGELSLTAGSTLDFELKESHQITVEITDGEFIVNTVITINVVDADENVAPTISDQTFDVLDNITDVEVIGTVAASDTNGDALTFEITEDADNLFDINSTGELSLRAGSTLDANTTASHIITVQASDGQATSTAKITISVTSSNVAPVISSQTFDVLDNITDVEVIGTVVASDANGDALTFEVTEDIDSLFEINSKAELSLITGSILDANTAASHTITVQVSDGQATASATVTINVTSSNVAPVISDQSFDASEDIGPSIIIGTISASHENANDLTFTITQNSGSLFRITKSSENTAELQLNADQSLDYATATSHTITVEVTDGDLTSSATITVNVIDVVVYDPANDFITVWQVGAGESVQLPIYNNTMPGTSATAYDFTVNWGDGTTSEVTSVDDPDANHTYTNAGEYTITITGTIQGFSFAMNNTSADKVRNVNQWGNAVIGIRYGTFMDSGLISIDAIDAPQIGTTLDNAFQNTAFNGEIGHWNVSSVTSMLGTFALTSNFNGDISNWDVSNVTNMRTMFFQATAFNQNISGWDVSSVQSFESMFYNSTVFNQDIGGWNVSNATNFYQMFRGATSMTANLSSWDMSSAISMAVMFMETNYSGVDITNWNVSNVEQFGNMFYGNTSFNQDISGWDMSSAINTQSMFHNASSFNQDISGWNVSNVQSMMSMFQSANKFNRDISGWDVSNVTSMYQMFNGAFSFFQDLSGWNTINVTQCSNFAAGCPIDGTAKMPTLGSCF